ncbi:DNA replication complex GINS protein PSF3 [Schistocerca piceifrons]|uniref:DNA replication complex GINS protein PSF3 n=1 Tax=Schistocerca piceifrons TaxID=274613 RepID=UPI001F5F6FF8|nr:DNA replication complex GINS protein PSF3 [Schistocerca piceifrons]
MFFERSFFPDYFSIDDIMATQERVPCKFEVQVLRLGFLDQGSESEHINAGTNMELPYWLARALGHQRQKIVSVDIPKVYKEAYREILKADSCVVDLYKFGAYFYEFGIYISLLGHREGPEIREILVKTFRERLRQVTDWAQNMEAEPGRILRLDTLERGLLHSGQKAHCQLEVWLTSGAGGLVASTMVVQHKKRRLAMENQI